MWKSVGNSYSLCNSCQYARKFTTTTVNTGCLFNLLQKLILTLVMMMSPVNLWKARQVQLTDHIAHAANCACAVLNSENSLSSHKFKLTRSISSSTFNKFSPGCSIDLHNPFLTFSMRHIVTGRFKARTVTTRHDVSRKKSWMPAE